MAKSKDAYTVIPVDVEEKEMEEKQPATDKTDQAQDELEERFDKEFWLMVRICKVVFIEMFHFLFTFPFFSSLSATICDRSKPYKHCTTWKHFVNIVFTNTL